MYPGKFYYEDGSFKLIDNDTFKTLERFEDKTFDMIFADPPYFLSNDGITCSGGKMVSVNKGRWDKTLSISEKHEFNRNWIKECYRVLKKGGILVSGLDNGINFISNDEKTIENHFPFNPLKDPKQLKTLKEDDSGVQFSHTMEEQIGGQLKAGFTLVDIYEDTNGEGYLHELNIPTFIATKSIKK